MDHRYRVVDVFTEHPLEGNALAVFPDATAMDGALMPRIARELNLSETVFVLPPSDPACAARLRIFTPAKELIFAGHPTVGSAFVLLDEGRIPSGTEPFSLEEGVGPVPIRVEPGEPAGGRPLIWLRTPPVEFGRTVDPALCARALGLEASDLLPVAPQLVTAGNPALFVALKDQAAVDRCWLDLAGLQAIRASLTPAEADAFFVFVFTPAPQGAYSRMFAPEHGVVEDPATGSATGPLVAYMIRNRLVSGTAGGRFVSEQGTKMGRRSLLHVHILGQEGAEGIEVGGYVTPLIEATLRL
ncbi:MAG TPA: PhzF family phenazine biosynthesis protein [Acidobacteriaceae bacterium]|jgi:trans-2,3-dihydro-3-hydroxyanthranilate isomerase|nr:PhzF family phenazine biosynthesis protein [Acidobacteriaceae bacterium]